MRLSGEESCQQKGAKENESGEPEAEARQIDVIGLVNRAGEDSSKQGGADNSSECRNAGAGPLQLALLGSGNPL